jgi:hypothetical protein
VGHPFNQEAITHHIFGILLSIMILVLKHRYHCVGFEGNQSTHMAMQGALTRTHIHTLVADVTR